MLQKGVGDTLLIDVSPDRSLLSDDTDPTQRLNIGTRITQNLTVVYSAALDGTEKRCIVELNPGGGRFRLARDHRGGQQPLARGDGPLLVRPLEPRAAAAAPARARSSGSRRCVFAGEPAARRGRAARGRQAQAAPALQRAAARAGRGPRARAAGPRGLPLGERRGAHRCPADGRRRAGAARRAGPAGRDRVERRRPRKEGEAGGRAGVAGVRDARRPRPRRSRARRSAGCRRRATTRATRRAAGRAPARAGSTCGLRVTRGPKGTGVVVAFEGNQAARRRGAASRCCRSREATRSSRRSTRAAPGSRATCAWPTPASATCARALARTADRPSIPPRGRLTVTIGVRERAASTVAGIELPAELAADAARGAGAQARARRALRPRRPTSPIATPSASGTARRAGSTPRWARSLEARGPGVTVRYQRRRGRAAARRRDPGRRDRARRRSSLIRRSLTLREGDLVKPAALSESRERLSDIGIFRSVDVRAEPRRRRRRGCATSWWAWCTSPTCSSSTACATPPRARAARPARRPSTPDRRPDPGGRRRRAQQPVRLRREDARLRLPHDRAADAGASTSTRRRSPGIRVRTQLFVFDDSDDDIQISGVASRVRGTTLQQIARAAARPPQPALARPPAAAVGLHVQEHRVRRVRRAEPVAPGRPRLPERSSAIGDERDSLTDPKRGVFWTATSELARTGLGSDVDYVRLYGQFFAYVPLGPLVWAQGYRIGSVPGRGSAAADREPLPRRRADDRARLRAERPRPAHGREGDSLGGQAVAVAQPGAALPDLEAPEGRRLLGRRQRVGYRRAVRPRGPAPERRRRACATCSRSARSASSTPGSSGRQPGEPTGRFVFGLGHAF